MLDKKFLDLFWVLAEKESNKRKVASLKLIENLEKYQKKSENPESCSELKYSVKRLVRGLSSDRECARLGFAQALTQLLRKFPIVRFADIISELETHMKIEKNSSRKEKTNLWIGQVFTYLTLMQAGVLLKVSNNDLRKITEKLISVYKTKQAVQTVANYTLTLIVSQVTLAQFQEAMLAALLPMLQSGWEACTADCLWMLLTVLKHHKSALEKDFLKTHWGGKKIWKPENFDKFAAVVMNSTNNHPVIHPVSMVIVEQALQKSDTFEDMWSKCFTPLLANTPARKKLFFQTVIQALTLNPAPDHVKVILSENVLHYILKSAKSKTHSNDAVHQFLNDLPDCLKAMTNKQSQVAVIQKLISPPAHVRFDVVTKSNCLNNCIRQLKVEAVEDFVSLLKDMFLGVTASSGDLETRQRWASSQLGRICSLPREGGNFTLPENVLYFLFLHGFFHVEKASSACSTPPAQPVSQSVAQGLQTTFYSVLGKIAATGADKKMNQTAYNNMLLDLAGKIEELRTNEAVKCRTTLQENVAEHWKKALSAAVKLNKHTGEERNETIIGAFQLLYLQLGLELWRDPKGLTSALDDIHVCQKKALKEVKGQKSPAKKATHDEPSWTAVVTDLLLNLLSRSNHTLRRAVKTAASLLCSHFTPEAIQLIIETFQSKPDDEDGDMEFEDDDDDDEETAMDETDAAEKAPVQNDDAADDVDTDEGYDDEEDEDDDDDDDEDEDDDDKDDDQTAKLRAEVKAALGKAAIPSDAESEGEELTDSEMEKLDGVLADAFKVLKKGKKVKQEKKLQLQHFRLRCLDLFEAVIQHDNRPESLALLVQPLLETMEESQKNKDLKDVHNRCTDLYHKLCKRKTISKDSTPAALHQLPSLVNKLINLSKTVTGISMVQEVGKGIAFLLQTVPSSTQRPPAGSLPNGLSSPPHASEHSPLLQKKGKRKRRDSNSDDVDRPSKKQKLDESAHRETETLLLDAVHKELSSALEDFCHTRDSLLSHLLFHEICLRPSVLSGRLLGTLSDLAADESVRIYCRSHMWSLAALIINKNLVSSMAPPDWLKVGTNVRNNAMQVIEKQSSMSSDECKPKYLQESISVLLKLFGADRNLKADASEEFSTKVQQLSNKLKNKDIKSNCRKLLNSLAKSVQ